MDTTLDFPRSPRSSQNNSDVQTDSGMRANKWPKFGLSPLRALIIKELSEGGVSGKKFTPASAGQVAEVACAIARFGSERAGTVPEREAEQQCCDLLAKGTPLGKLPRDTATAHFIQNFDKLVPDFLKSRVQHISGVHAHKPAKATQLAGHLVSRARTLARLCANRGWSSGLSADTIDNPLVERADWSAVPLYAIWRAREQDRIRAGSRSPSSFLNLASQVHSFLEYVRSRGSERIDRDAEAAVWERVKTGLATKLPQVDGHPTVTEQLVLHGLNLRQGYKKRLATMGESTEVVARSAMRALFTEAARQCPQFFPPQTQQALRISTATPLPPLALLGAWSRSVTDEVESQRTIRVQARKFARFVMQSEKLSSSVESEREAYHAVRKAAKHGAVRFGALPKNLQGTVTVVLLSNVDQLAQRYAKEVNSSRALSADQKAARLLTARRFLIWAKEERLCSVDDTALAALARGRAPQDRAPVVRAALRNAKRSKRVPAPRSKDRVDTHRSASRKAAEQAPAKVSAVLKLKPEVQKAQPDLRSRAGYTFVSERRTALQRNNKLARLKQFYTLECLVRASGGHLTLWEILHSKASDYFPNLAALQVKSESGKRQFKCDDELNQKLRDYCETAVTSPLGRIWQKMPDAALLFPGAEGDPLFSLGVSKQERQIGDKLMRLQVDVMEALLRCTVAPASSKSPTADRPVTFRDIASLRPEDLSAAENVFLLRAPDSGQVVGQIMMPKKVAALARDLRQHLRVSSGAVAGWGSAGDSARLFMSADAAQLLPDDYE